MSEQDQSGTPEGAPAAPGAPGYPTQPLTAQPPGPPAPPSYLQPGYQGYGGATTLAPPAPPPWEQVRGGAGTPTARNRGLRVVGAVVAGLLLLGAGFGLGRLSAPSGPASLIDAVRMTQQGTLPCGSPNTGPANGGFLSRLCQNRPGQNGPGQGFGPGQNGPGQGFGPGNGKGNGLPGSAGNASST